MIQAVLFDLDNTLIDFMKMKKMSCAAAIDAMIGAGLSVNESKAMKILFELYDRYGLEEKTIFQKFLRKVEGKVDYKILASGIVAYRNVRSGFLDPFPYADYVLLKLRAQGLKLGIVSDAPKLKAWIRLAAMRMTNYFDVVVTHDDTGKLKPNPAPYQLAVKKLGVEPENCIFVGDWPVRDIKGAKRMGMVTCFARYGNMKASRTDADHELKNLKELLKIVKA